MIVKDCIVSVLLDYDLKPKEQNMSSVPSLSFTDAKNTREIGL